MKCFQNFKEILVFETLAVKEIRSEEHGFHNNIFDFLSQSCIFFIVTLHLSVNTILG